MYNLVVCDDDIDFIELIKNKLSIYKNFNVLECSNKKDFFKIINNNQIDAVIMDIKLDEDNGIDMIKELNKNIEIIYITGYPEYCTDVYETNHAYFLTKPLKEKDFHKAIKKILDNLNKRIKQYILIKEKSLLRKINLKKVLYIESFGRKSIIHLKNEAIETYIGISKLFGELNYEFIMCHKSFIVNMNYIKSINSKNIVLDNDKNIPISQSKYHNSKIQFLEFIRGE